MWLGLAGDAARDESADSPPAVPPVVMGVSGDMTPPPEGVSGAGLDMGEGRVMERFEKKEREGRRVVPAGQP
jgi:hypothetical protein